MGWDQAKQDSERDKLRIAAWQTRFNDPASLDQPKKASATIPNGEVWPPARSHTPRSSKGFACAL
jgi:hypothetical protein